VVAFLSDAWVAELDRAARSGRWPADLSLVIQQIVLEDDGTEVAYAIQVISGAASVVPGRVDHADITFTQDRATAEQIAKGALSAQVAFMAGRLRVGGDLREVLRRASEVGELGDLFAPARQAISW
jgi:hypothetical protein